MSASGFTQPLHCWCLPSTHFDLSPGQRSSGDLCSVPHPFRDRLACFYSVWILITTDNWVLSTIILGCAIWFFISPPHPPTLSHFRGPIHKTRITCCPWRRVTVDRLPGTPAFREGHFSGRGKSFNNHGRDWNQENPGGRVWGENTGLE